MRITQEADYAMRIVLALARRGEGIRLDAKSIATEENVPQRFALKILRKLTKAGVVKSFRGVQGGYAISRDPKDINMLDVIVAIDGPVYINRCLESAEACNLQRSEHCAIHNELGRVQEMINEEMAKVDFEALLKSTQKNAKL